MPPKITKVRWSAQNVPWGLSFNEKTGTFSGTPEDIGEYTVPVTVETNYGKDTKDVKIIVEPPLCDVYAIGTKAVTWAESGEADSDGFYKLSMPKANKLVAHYEGFGAITADKKYYCCGVTSLTTVNESLQKFDPPTFIITNKPYLFNTTGPSSPLTRVIVGSWYTSSYTGGSSSSTRTTSQAKWILTWAGNFGRGSCATSGTLKNTTVTVQGKSQSSTTVSPSASTGYLVTNTTGTTEDIKNDEIGDGFCVFGDSSILATSSPVNDLLYRTGNFVCIGGSFIALPEKCVKKFYPTQPFVCLAASGILYKYTTSGVIPVSCQYGKIKNAWGYGENAFFIHTEDNVLYQYNKESTDWDSLGAFDIKKLEVQNASYAWLITNDGELYHKGTAITGLFDEAHDTFTRIFPSLIFKDFTFGGNTLTVLRE